MIDAEKVLDGLCTKGKDLTIGITVTDRDLALKLMDTMNGHNLGRFGVTVNTWGFFNSDKAFLVREKLIAEEMARHTERMAYLNDSGSLKGLLDAN